MSDKLSASEAVFGFAGWLTTRHTRTIMSATDNASGIAELCAEFCKANALEPPRDRWSDDLVHPVEECPPGCFHAAPIDPEDTEG